jgi:hypothetical protein
MLNQDSAYFQPNPEAVSAKLAIKPLSEDTSELSDEQAEAISGGQSGLELSDAQLESMVGKRRSVIRVIGFEN